MAFISVHVEEALAELRADAAAAGDLRPATKVIAQRLRSDTMLNFREGGVYPRKWRPSRRAAGGNAQTLVGRAVLRNSFHADYTGTTARVGTDVKYAAVHQAGAVIVPRQAAALAWKAGGRWIFARRVEIPERPMLPVSESGKLRPETQAFVRQVVGKHLTGAKG